MPSNQFSFGGWGGGRGWRVSPSIQKRQPVPVPSSRQREEEDRLRERVVRELEEQVKSRGRELRKALGRVADLEDQLAGVGVKPRKKRAKPKKKRAKKAAGVTKMKKKFEEDYIRARFENLDLG